MEGRLLERDARRPAPPDRPVRPVSESGTTIAHTAESTAERMTDREEHVESAAGCSVRLVRAVSSSKARKAAGLRTGHLRSPSNFVNAAVGGIGVKFTLCLSVSGGSSGGRPVAPATR
jgi:hypothetical protein